MPAETDTCTPCAEGKQPTLTPAQIACADFTFFSPILELIATTPGLPERFQKVSGALGVALDTQEARSERLEAAADLERLTRALDLDQRTCEAVCLEAWELIGESLPSPLLWERIVFAKLQVQIETFRAHLHRALPDYERPWLTRRHEDRVRIALEPFMAEMLARRPEEFITSVDEATAAIRLARLCILEDAHWLGDAENTFSVDQAVALGLWQRLELRLWQVHHVAEHGIDPASMESSHTDDLSMQGDSLRLTERIRACKPPHDHMSPGEVKLEEHYGTAARQVLVMYLTGRNEASRADTNKGRSGIAQPSTPPGLAGTSAETPLTDPNRAAESAASEWSPLMHLVAASPFPAASGLEERNTLARFAPLSQPMAMPPMPSWERLHELIEVLHVEFPWATQAIDIMGRQLLARQRAGSLDLAWSPLLLVGPPGCGKSRLSRRWAELLGLPNLSLSLSGAHDTKLLLGTSRGWQSAQPSPILQFMAYERAPRAVILLDEIDKVHRWADGAALNAALLNLLEPETSRRWHDNFLQVKCDLSKLLFIATANQTLPLGAPLLSRLQPVLVPEPQRAHYPGVAKHVLIDIAREWGVPTEALEPVDVNRIAQRARNVRDLKLMLVDEMTRFAHVPRVLH